MAKKSFCANGQMCPSAHNRESRNKGYKPDSQNLICEVFHLSTFWNTCGTFNLSFFYPGICCRPGCSNQFGELRLVSLLRGRQNAQIVVSFSKLSVTKN